MRKLISFLFVGIFTVLLLAGGVFYFVRGLQDIQEVSPVEQKKYWFLLHRKSNVEYLYFGISGNKVQSELVRIFSVKTGVVGKRPTPLPQLLGRTYWVITKKYETKDYPETSPYFLSLNIPISEEEPFGPSPYTECDGQCNWELPGEFGLHGVNGDVSRLSIENEGSSGCIRHSDQDITFLFQLLDPEKSEIRYYIEDV